MNEHDILVICPSTSPHEPNQSGKCLARIDRIEHEAFESGPEPDRRHGSVMRYAVSGAGVAGHDFDIVRIERPAEQCGRGLAMGQDVGVHPFGLGVDIYADDARMGQAAAGADHEPRLRAATAGAMHDRRRCDAERIALPGDLLDGRGVGYGAERVRDTVRHDVRPAALRALPLGEGIDRAIAVAVPGHLVQFGAEQAVEQGTARLLVVDRRWREPTVIDGKMAGKAQPGRGGGDLPLAVGLHDAPDARVSAPPSIASHST